VRNPRLPLEYSAGLLPGQWSGRFEFETRSTCMNLVASGTQDVWGADSTNRQGSGNERRGWAAPLLQ